MQRVLLLLFLFGQFSQLAADTVLKLYRPYGEVVNQVQPMIKRKIAGNCFAQSQIIQREDAWRCRAGEQFFDPCFVKATGTKLEAICPQSPWVGDSVAIVVNTPLQGEQHVHLDMSRAYPWGIELVNGEFCQAVQTNEIYDSQPIRYRCTHQHVLFGSLQRCKPVWSVLEKTVDGVRNVEISRAWF